MDNEVICLNFILKVEEGLLPAKIFASDKKEKAANSAMIHRRSVI
jgi:hypothetical protein